jgi:hypothetical protein
MHFCAPISTMHFFSVALTTCALYFCIVHQYPLRTVLVSRTDTPHAFRPMHCTMSKFNIFHHAQLSVHTTEYTVMRQLILILMRIPTKLLCVKKYLCTPCAHYYVCAHHARLNSMHASTHNNILRSATIYRAHWHANVFPRAPIGQPFPWTLYDSNFGHFEVTLP